MLKKKILLILVKMVRKTLFRSLVISVKTTATGERAGSILNTKKTAGDLQPSSRVRGSVDGILLRGDIRGGDSC